MTDVKEARNQIVVLGHGSAIILSIYNTSSCFIRFAEDQTCQYSSMNEGSIESFTYT